LTERTCSSPRWFSGSLVVAGEDDVFDKVVRAGKSPHVRFVKWDTPDELRTFLIETLSLS